MKLMVKRRDKRKFTEICRKLFYTIIAIVAAKGAPLGVVGGWVGGIFYGKTMANSGKIIQWSDKFLLKNNLRQDVGPPGILRRCPHLSA